MLGLNRDTSREKGQSRFPIIALNFLHSEISRSAFLATRKCITARLCRPVICFRTHPYICIYHQTPFQKRIKGFYVEQVQICLFVFSFSKKEFKIYCLPKSLFGFTDRFMPEIASITVRIPYPNSL